MVLKTGINVKLIIKLVNKLMYKSYTLSFLSYVYFSKLHFLNLGIIYDNGNVNALYLPVFNVNGNTSC